MRRFDIRRGMALVLVAAALGLTACGDQDASGVDPQALATTKRTVRVTAPLTPAAETPIDQLRTRARQAFAAGRLVSPAEDNALAINLEVLSRNPGDEGANEAVMDLFPAVVSAAEQAMLSSRFDEAERLLDLLGRANPTSAAGMRMREQLDRARAMDIERVAAAAKAQKGELEALAQADSSAPTPAAQRDAPTDTAVSKSATPPMEIPPTSKVSVATSGSAVESGARAAENDTRTTARADAPIPTEAVVATSETPTKPEPIAQVTDFAGPEVLTRVNPDYPASARSRRLSGWVDLEFVVNTAGRAEEIRIVGAQPQNLFDRSAQRALTRWRFKPAQRNGAAEPAKSRTRINFSAT